MIEKVQKKKISKKKKKVVAPKVYKCPHCDKVFDKPQGAGGHISKIHPGVSKVYSKKMETRNARAP